MVEEKMDSLDTNTIKVNLDCGDFLEQLVNRCEVQSYPELYHKLLDKKGGIIRCNDLFDKDPKKSLEKLESTTLNIPDVLLINLFDPRITNTTNPEPNSPFQKIPYIINEKGLARVIFNYRKEHFISQDITFTGLCELWGINENQMPKLIDMIDKIIEKKMIYASWKETINENDEKKIKKLVFKKISEVPEKRKQISQLILASVIVIVALVLFISFIINNHI